MSTTQEVEPRGLLTIREAATYAGIGRDSFYELVASGRVPHVKFSERVIRIPRDALDAWIAAECERNTVEGSI